MAGNKVEQIVKLNTKQYTDALTNLKTQTQSAFKGVQTTLFGSERSYEDFCNTVKKQSASVQKTLGEMGKSFVSNLGKGAAIGAAGTAALAIKTQMSAAVKTGLDFDKALAALGSRADLSTQRLDKLRKTLYQLGKSGADLATLPGAVQELYGATGDVEKATQLMNPITKAAAMGSGDAEVVAKFAKTQLKGEGKDLTQANVQSLMESLVLTMRGGDFKNLDEAMAAYQGLDGATKRRSGLSDREYAATLAGATKAGQDRETSVAGMEALIKKATEGFHGSAALEGILGGKLTDRSGKFSLDKLSGAAGRYQRSGFKDQDFIKLLEGAGVSNKEAEGIVSVLKEFKAVTKGIDNTLRDRKTLDQAYQETTNNLTDALQKRRNEAIGGFSDILHPWEGLGKKAVSGDVLGALAGVPKAAGESLGQAASHPGLTALTLGGLAAGGWAAGKFGKILGIGGVGGAAQLAAGVGKGAALKQAGVTPVYVVNASELADFMSGKGPELPGLPGGASKLGGVLGKLATVGKFVGKAGGVVGAGAIGYQIGTGLNTVLDEKTQGRTADGFEGSAVERLIYTMEKLIGTDRAKAIQVGLEVHAVDPGFKVVPKAGAVKKNAKGL